MPYLTRALLDPLRSRTRELFASPQQLKALILGGFVDQPVNGRVLWRLDSRSVAGTGRAQGELLVLSPEVPSLHGLIEVAGYPGATGEHLMTRDYAPVLDMVAVGREFAFKTRVNPVQAVRPSGGSEATPDVAERIAPGGERLRGSRVPHRTAAHQSAWFLQRAHGWGFEVLGQDDPLSTQMRIVERRQLDFTKRSSVDRHRVRLSTATLEGLLRVRDAERFKQVLLDGIGPAKGYGCGLLTLASVGSGQA